ncbi:TRAP transporter substrate-binding protein [Chloroflexota bacterium]
MVRKLLSTLLIVLVLAALTIAGCAAPAPAPAPSPSPSPAPAPSPEPVKPIELKLGHNSSTRSGSHAGFMEPWAKNVEEATNGKVKITIYPSETLFKAKEAMVAVEKGMTDMAWVLVGFYPGRFPLADIISLPFINLPSGTVDGRELGPYEINSHILMELFEKFPEMQAEWAGVKPLIIHTSGPTSIWSNKLISNLDEIKGLKIRSYSGPDADMWELLGASPIAMPLPAVYENAEKGVLEACNVDWGGVNAYKVYEVLPYRVNNVAITVGRYALVMNQDKWDSLPPDVQDAITSLCGVRGAEFAGAGMGMGAGTSMDNMVRNNAEKAGKPLTETDFSAADIAKWKTIIQPMYNKYIDELEAKGLPAQKIFDEAQNLIEKYK